ncbi:uncharacterized protein LOC134688472 isoform X2 [Mytilus trossulus]|uniref:uncharacterized protein LOC134688472 isoform X2 n=1 Tax=Mytilus trossulus TaxID=6551 RepID=UPI003006554F
MDNIWEKLDYMQTTGNTEQYMHNDKSSVDAVNASSDILTIVADQNLNLSIACGNTNENKHRKDFVDQFVIPKKIIDYGLLSSLKEDSREYQHEVLPSIVRSFRYGQSKSRYRYSKPYLVQNKRLEEQFHERKREFRQAGYSDKEIKESYGFLYVSEEQNIEQICGDGLKVGNLKSSCLGHADMGVQLCKHADVIRPGSVSSKYSGYLVIFKVIKGKVKQVVENHTNIPLEPTPNYDCHLVASSDSSSNHAALFNSSQIYAYEYGEESICEIPRQVMPFAVVKFLFTPKSNSRTNTNTVAQSTSSRTSASLGPMASSVKDAGETYIVWNGALTVKGMHACNINMVSSASWFKPAKLGTDIDITHKLEASKVKQKYLKHTGKLAKNCENHSGNYYINICELHPSKPGIKGHFQKIMNYLGKHDCIAVQKLEDVILLLLTQGQLSYQLGLSQPHKYPVVLYCLFLSRNSRKKNSGSEEEDDKDKEKEGESNSLEDKSKVEEKQVACVKTVKDLGGENSTVCDMELCDSGESNIAVSLPIVQLSSPCHQIVSTSKSPSVCIGNTLFESPTSLGTKDSENDSPKLDKICPTKVTPEILKLPPDYPYKKNKDSVSILKHLNTSFGRTNENYVVATVWDNGKPTSGQMTPVREGETTPIRFVSPPTPGTPTLDERQLMHYYTSPLEKSQDDPNNNRDISSIEFNPSPHLDRAFDRSQLASPEQRSRVPPQPPTLNLEESIARESTDEPTCPHLEKEEVNYKSLALEEKSPPVSKDQSQLILPCLTSHSLQLDKSNNSSSILPQPRNESESCQNRQSEENLYSKSPEIQCQSLDKSLCITSSHSPVSLKCIPLPSCETAISSDVFSSDIPSVSTNSDTDSVHSPGICEPISTVGQSNSPLKFRTTPPQFIQSPTSQVLSPPPYHTSPRLPTIYQLAFQSTISRAPIMYSPPSYNTYPPRHWSPLGYQQHCYNYNRMSTPMRPSGYYEPRMAWPPWDLSPPRPLMYSPPYQHRKPSLLGVAPQGVQPWSSRPLLPLIGNVDSVRSRLQVNPAPSCPFNANSQQETNSSMMKTLQQNTSKEMSAQSLKPGQNANEIGHQSQPQTVSTKFTVPAAVISPIKPVTLEVGVLKPLVPYTDTENNCISEPLVPYTDISEEVVICKPLVPYTDVGNDVVQSIETVNHTQELLQNCIELNRENTEPSRELVDGHVGSDFIGISDGELPTETSIASNKSLDKYENGFMTKPPKSSLIQQVKIKDDFRVQEKAHELHSILKRSPRLIMTSVVGKGYDYAPKIDFTEELSMKQEPVDDTIDNIIQFLDFDSKSPGTSKVDKSGNDMNSSNKKSAKKGYGQKQPHTVTNKDVENMRKLLNDTLERTSPKKKSSGDCKKTRRQSSENCLDKAVDSQMNSQNIASKSVKGSLKHPLSENSSDVACKKIKLETDRDRIPVLGSVQAMEITTCSDSSDLELIESQPPPFIDLTSPIVDLTESPSPIRIVRTVTGYVVEKSCKTKLIVDTDSGMKLKKSNISSRLYDTEKDNQISNKNLLTEKEGNMKDSDSKTKAKTSSNGEIKVKCSENLKYGSKNEQKSGTENIKQSVNKLDSRLRNPEKTSGERENKRENSALNLKKTDKSVEKCKTSDLEKKENPRELSASDSQKTDKDCEKSKLSEGSKTIGKDDKESNLKKKNISIEISKSQSENKELSEVKTTSELKKKEKSNIAFSLGSIVSEMRKNERSEEKDKLPLDNKENANTIVKPVVKNRNKSPKNLQKELEFNSASGEKIDDKNRTDKSKVIKELSNKTSSNKDDKQQVNVGNKEKSSNKSLSTSERHKHRDSSLTSDSSHERDNRKSSSKSNSEELSKKTRWDIVMKDLDYDTQNRVSRKRKDSESDSDARSSRKGSPPVMYVSGKKSKSKRSSSGKKFSTPSKKTASKSRTASPSPSKQKSVFDYGLLPRKEWEFKIPKKSTNAKDDKQTSGKMSSNKREESTSSKSPSIYNGKENDYKSNTETARDSNKISEKGKHSSRKSSSIGDKEPFRLFGKEENKNSKGFKEKVKPCKSSVVQTTVPRSKDVGSIMQMIRSNVLNKDNKKNIDDFTVYSPSDSLTDNQSEVTSGSTEETAQDLMDIMDGKVPLEIIDEVGTDTDSMLDNSSFNISNEYAKDLNSAIPGVYGSKTKHLSGDILKSKSITNVDVANITDTQKDMKKDSPLIYQFENTHMRDLNDNLVTSAGQNLNASTLPEKSTSSNLGSFGVSTLSTNRPVGVIDPLDDLDFYIPSVNRKVEEVNNGKQMRITVKNDCPLNKTVLGYSLVELIKTCLHGKQEDMRIVNLQESIIQRSVNLTLHKLNIAATLERTVDKNDAAPIIEEEPSKAVLKKEEELIPGLGDLHDLEEAIHTSFNEEDSENNEDKAKTTEVLKCDQVVATEATKSLQSLKKGDTVKNIEISPIRGPESKKSVPEPKRTHKEQSKENSNRGPIRSAVSKAHRQDRQHHPYSRKEKHYKAGWSFDISYTLQDIMENLTTSSYKDRKNMSTPNSRRPRFSNYRFRRSEVPEFLPDEREDNYLTEEAIPDFVERKKKAEMLDNMSTVGGEDEPFSVEQTMYDRETEPPRESHREHSRETEPSRKSHREHSRETEPPRESHREHSRETEPSRESHREHSRETEPSRESHREHSRETEPPRESHRDHTRETEPPRESHRDQSREQSREDSRSRNVSRQLNKEESKDKKTDHHDDDDIQYLGTESSQQNWQNQVKDFLGQCASKSPKKKRSRRFRKRKR